MYSITSGLTILSNSPHSITAGRSYLPDSPQSTLYCFLSTSSRHRSIIHLSSKSHWSVPVPATPKKKLKWLWNLYFGESKSPRSDNHSFEDQARDVRHQLRANARILFTILFANCYVKINWWCPNFKLLTYQHPYDSWYRFSTFGKGHNKPSCFLGSRKQPSSCMIRIPLIRVLFIDVSLCHIARTSHWCSLFT